MEINEIITERKTFKNALVKQLNKILDFIEKIDAVDLGRTERFDINLLDEFFSNGRDTKEGLIKDITDKLKEFGYTLEPDPGDPDILNIVCQHGKLHSNMLILEDADEQHLWFCDYGGFASSIKDCEICYEDHELKESMIGRLINYKFNSAQEYIDALKKQESIECLNILSDTWGNTGWDVGDTLFGNIIDFFVEFIMLNEGWKKEYYNEE